MSVKRNIPQIESLILAVEHVVGKPLMTHNDFLSLVDAIGDAQNDHMSESTLERLWGYSTRNCEAVSVRTLNVLSRYVGASSWKGFCDGLGSTSPKESEEIAVGEFIDVSALDSGAVLKLGWMPDRMITIEYQGEFRFRVLNSENSSISPGDSFSCYQIRKGRELYLEKYMRSDSDKMSCYVVGQNHGITFIEEYQ